ncbi:hypothetical protein TSOC_001732 [Tetrabaena socialis]|uniref:phytol kinase n=1 Tax=Tetrabaena socialis TaxID=47790 RepID=A0A2J8AFW4_9CHLO|nr:hypothetical protein TSOC_001732 [Tetrabaena socialis]|eukprot:PNH11382.1 hypothetical protein TSOC_001732 [Tetrabaena socialis]
MDQAAVVDLFPDVAAARLTGIPGSGGPLSAEECRRLQEDLGALLDCLNGAPAPAREALLDALLHSKAKSLASLRLVAWVLHEPRDPAHRLVCELMAYGALQVGAHLLSAAPALYARKVLRMGTLGACSRRFAAVIGEPSAAAGGAGVVVDGGAETGEGSAVAVPAPAAAGAQGPSEPQQFRLLSISMWINNLLGRAFAFLQQGADMTQQQRRFASELAAALRDSQVLEHGARAVLHLHLALAGEEMPDWVRALAWGALGTLNLVQAVYRLAERLGQPVQSSFGQLLSGPCARHMALSFGLAALCAADGGPSYGLPPQLMLRLPVFGAHTGHFDLRHAHGMQELTPMQLQCMLYVMMDSDIFRHAAAPAQPGPRGTLAVLLRVGRLALASAQAWGGMPASGGVGAAQPTRQLVTSSSTTIALGQDVLHRAFRIIKAQQQRLAEAGAVWQPGVRELLALDEVECWRISYGLMRHGLRWATEKEVDALLMHVPKLQLGAMPPNGALPVAMPPILAGALAAGLLPFLEGVLRRANHAAVDGTDSTVLALFASLSYQGGLWPLVARALAYGEPRQAAALVATLGKALRTFAVPVLKAGALSTRPSCLVAECTAALARHLLLGAVGWLEVAGVRGDATAAAAAATSPPQQQLKRLMSYAVCEWLPPLCDLLSHYTTLTLSGQIDVQSAAYSRDVAALSAFATVRNRWLPVLARRAERSEVEARAVPGCAAAGEGWRQLLLGSLGVVSALGEALAAVPRRGEGPRGARGFDSMGPLAEACCCVAAALPREVRAAAVEVGVRAVAGGGAAGSGAVGGQSGGAHPGRGSGAPAPLIAGWSLESARRLAAALRAKREEGAAAAAEALEAQLGRWVAGGGEEGTAGVRSAVRALGRLPQIDRAARALLSDPAHARSLLRTCANPACDNLAGESEADLTLLKCGGCSVVWYCRRQCQAAHWGSGHKQACKTMGRQAV